jgi:hypothetical protein
MGGGLGGVKRRKALRVAFFCLRGFESHGEFFSGRGRPVTGFERNVFCICAACYILTKLAQLENEFVHL